MYTSQYDNVRYKIARSFSKFSSSKYVRLPVVYDFVFNWTVESVRNEIHSIKR